MKLIRNIFLFNLLLMTQCTTVAQKQTFDVLSYETPKGWDKIVTQNGVQLSTKDDGKGNYAAAVIVRSVASTALPGENFNNSWESLVKKTVQVDGEPAMQDPSTENGWDIISGNAGYTDGSNKGIVTLLTATGGGKTVSVVLMTNTQQYQNELLAFINSLELKKITTSANNNNSPSTNTQTNNNAITGIWCNNLLETVGYANGYPQYSGGYFRKEYVFYEDGTYMFRIKNWSNIATDILFVFESGTYTVQGNKLTISPQKTTSEWWSKKDNRTEHWGIRLKPAAYKTEKITYTFEIKYYALYLDSKKTTERDGTYNAANPFTYTKRKDGTFLIDNPPGFKTGFENKPLTSSAPSQENTTSTGNASNTAVAGLWTNYVLETNGYSINGSPQYTAGYLRKEYNFYPDGSYLFRNKQWLVKAPNIVFQYETGTYSVNGNQLTLTPDKGKGGFWKKTNSSKEWGSLIKSSDYSLEKTTYTFQIIIDNTYGNSIVLKSSKPTQRDGGQFNASNDPYEFHYKFRKLESSIDNPPGIETGF